MEAQQIEEMIRAAMPNADVSATDLQDSGDHFEVTVVSDAFEGRTMVEQHRLVYAALGDSLRSAIHALVIKTMTPEQYRAGLVTEIGKTE